MARYRLLEITDTLIGDGKPFWCIEKHILGLWWSEYFEEHSEHGATFTDKEIAMKWYEHHAYQHRRDVKIIAQNK